VTSLRELGRAMTESHGASYAVNIVGENRSCVPIVKEQLLRISQEALRNALGHGQARRVSIELKFHPDCLLLRVLDNGCGFDADSLLYSTPGHCGIASMRERAAVVGGSFNITSLAGRETRVEVVVPLQAGWDQR
jgi:signal transduction histidine kinase